MSTKQYDYDIATGAPTFAFPVQSYGWLCSRCGASNAPHMSRCGCVPDVASTPSPWITGTCAHEWQELDPDTPGTETKRCMKCHLILWTP